MLESNTLSVVSESTVSFIYSLETRGGERKHDDLRKERSFLFLFCFCFRRMGELDIT